MHKLSAYVFQHRKKLLIITTFLSFLYFLWEANSWKYSFVGDMWHFYEYALRLSAQHYTAYPFSFDGVFGKNSVLASYYQALFMDILVKSNFVWRLSNIILIFPISYFFYRWLVMYFDWKTATVATILMQFSFYLSTFFKIPYINPQALSLFVLSLFLAARAGFYPTKRNGFYLGITLGLSFYIYLGALFPLLVWPYLLPLIRKKPRRILLPFFATLSVTYFALISLLLPTAGTLSGVLGGAGAVRESFDMLQIIANIGNNFLVFYKEFPIIATHFLPFPYLDTLSQFFALIGTTGALLLFRANKYRYLLLTYVSTCLFLGLTNPYTTPPTSRGMFLVLFGFIFAALGIMYVAKIKYYTPWIAPIVLIIIGFNLALSQFFIFQRIDYTGMALINREIHEAQQEKKREVVLILSPSQMINKYIYYLSFMQLAYGTQNIDLMVIRPSTYTCQFLENKKVLVFSYDAESLKDLTDKRCLSKYEVLKTSVTYY